ncbi:MAG: IclR family transcriptional regulator [Beutenbergiaceae bacterium]
MPARSGAPRNSSQSLRRGVQLLHVVAAAANGIRGVSISELARDMGIHMSSVSRLAAPLVEQGLLRRNASGRLQLGKGTLELGRAYLAGLDLWETAHEILQGANWPTEVRTVVGIPDGGEVRVLARSHARRTRSGADGIRHAEHRAPMHASAAGKVMLAFGGRSWTDQAIKTGLPAATERTITDPTELRSELARVRVRGYAICDRELDPTLRSVAAPVLDLHGSVVGAVEVAAPAVVMSPPRLRQAAAEIIRAAREISRALGSPQSSEP